MARELFREKSLERLSSPEQLDSLLQVTTIPGWIALIGSGILLLTSVFWAFFGTIPIKVSGIGIIMHPSGIFSIRATSVGVFRSAAVREGDEVKSGQVIAYIERPKLAGEIAKQKQILRQMQKTYRQLAAVHLEKEKSQHISTKGSNGDPVGEFDIFLEAGKGIGLLDDLHIRIIEIQGDLDMLEREHDDTTRILSPYDGIVLEIDMGRGEVFAQGHPIMMIEILREGEEIQALLGFAAADGKKIHQGMNVQINPAIVNHEEYGYMHAVIEDVSKFPISHSGLMRIVQNEEMVALITKKGPPIGAVARLVHDPATHSGYKWSSVKGPPLKIHAGTFCSALVVIDEKRPIDFLMPLITNNH